MKRLIILVEGDSEIILMNRLVIPHLYQFLCTHECLEAGWSIEAVKVTTNRVLNRKGGNVSYAYLVNEVRRFVSQGCTMITTFFDFFRLPADFPGYTKDGSRIEDVEKAMKYDMSRKISTLPEFIPYIQKYEFEALLFSGIEGFELILDDMAQLERIKGIMNDYENPEEINGAVETAPSKRLSHIFDYNKTIDSELVLEILGLDVIKNKCPRFENWLKTIADKLVDLS